MFAYIVIAIVVVLVAIAIGIKIRYNHPPEHTDWTGQIFRPCCRHCAYWVGLSEAGEGYCEKTAEYTVWDYCCMDYDGIDTEVKDYGVDCDDV